MIKTGQLGLGAATAVLLLLTALFGKEAYIDWAWRIPFLFSVILVIVGAIVRSRVSESPIFQEIQERADESSAPLRDLLRTHTGTVLKAAFIFAANNACGYMIIAFMGSYAAKKLGLPQTEVFLAVIIAASGSHRSRCDARHVRWRTMCTARASQSNDATTTTPMSTCCSRPSPTNQGWP